MEKLEKRLIEELFSEEMQAGGLVHTLYLSTVLSHLNPDVLDTKGVSDDRTQRGNCLGRVARSQLALVGIQLKVCILTIREPGNKQPTLLLPTPRHYLQSAVCPLAHRENP